MIELTKKELATVAGYTYRRLYDIDMGLPENKKLFVKGEGGKYDLALFVQRWVEYNSAKDSDLGELCLEDIKAIHEQVKTQKTELEVARMRGQLVDIEDVRRVWGDIANSVMQNMIRLPSKIAPQVQGMSNAQMIAGVIDHEIRDALTIISETPLPDYAAPEAAKDDDSEDDD